MYNTAMEGERGAKRELGGGRGGGECLLEHLISLHYCFLLFVAICFFTYILNFL